MGEKRNKRINFEDIPEDIVFYNILPWVLQFKFREQRIPRILIDYTRIERPEFLIEYNQFNDFKVALYIPLLFDK